MSAKPKKRAPRVDHEERRRRLAEACAYLIATDGYSNTSVRDVAAREGISTGTLLHHFSTKEELLVATLLHVSEDFLDHMKEAVASSEDPVEQLRALVRALLDPERHSLGWLVWIAFWHEAAADPALAKVANGQTDQADSLISATVQRGIDAGRLNCEDAETSAAELAALVDGIAIRVYGEAGRWEYDRAVAVLDRLIDDWLA